MNEPMNVMADEAIISRTQSMQATSGNAVTGTRLPQRDEAFEARAATFSSAMNELRKLATLLDGFDLRVQLKWKQCSDKRTPPPDEINFPALPRYVSDDIERLVTREEAKQRRMRQAKVEAETNAKDQARHRALQSFPENTILINEFKEYLRSKPNGEGQSQDQEHHC